MEEALWTERHRPKTIDDTILPERYKATFNKMIETGNIPNIILQGQSGIGKTTVAKAMLDQIGSPSMIINGSLDGNKDTLRNEIKDFASAMAMEGGRKYVILDEADGLSHNMQPALRNFMEEFSANCGFILTCNYAHKIIPPLHSRCALIEFNYHSSERNDLVKQTVKRVFEILQAEKVEFDPKVVATLVTKKFPDIRKVLNELQRYANNGKIDTGILIDFDEISLKQLVEAIKGKTFDQMHSWVMTADLDQHEVFDKIFEISRDQFTPGGAATAAVLLAEYQYKAAFAVNPKINLTACLVEMAANVEWK